MRTIKQLYPPWLLSIILYVQLTFLLVNYAVYDFRELIILFCWIPIATMPYLITKKRIFYLLAVCLFFAGGFINLCHLLIVKGPISASYLFVMLNTNMSEAHDFIHLKFNWRLLFIIPYIILFVIAIRNDPREAQYRTRKIIVAIVFLFSILFIGESVVHGRLVRKGIPQTAKALISFKNEMKSYKAMKKRKVQLVDASLQHPVSNDCLVVIIIGESCNRNHMSLYKYKRETNPKLKGRNDLMAYNDVVSAYSNTIPALLSMLSESNTDNNLPFDKSISLIDIFHSAGFTTYWLSNQSPLGVWDNAVCDLARTSDITSFVNNFGNSSMESAMQSSYDERLSDPFQAALTNKTGNKFIVIHLLGSHAAYQKRYPSSYEKFTGHSTKKEKLIDEYDNSVLYNDFIVDHFLQTISTYCTEHTGTIASLVYLSDHSENVYDENNNVGHDYSGILPKANVEIPFMVWLSEGFKKVYPEKQPIIEEHKNFPFESDDLFHCIIDLSDIKNNAFSPNRSIFSKNYNASRIRILEDHTDYDKK